MKKLLLSLLGIESICGYSMHDLNNNENTWEIAGCHSQPIRAETNEKFIVTSGFPNIYSQRMDCTWKIQTKPGQKIEITFPHFQVDFCQAAGVSVYDGQKLESKKVDTYCGIDNPDTFTSSGNEVQIQAYQQQSNNPGNGIYLMIGYRIAPEAPRTPPPSQVQQMMMPGLNPGLNQNQILMAYGGAAFPQQAYGLQPVGLAGGYQIIGRATTPPPPPPPQPRTPAPKRAPKKKAPPKKKKPSAKGDYIKAGIQRNLAAEARAREAELEKEREIKAKANKVLKKRLVFLIIGLVIVTIGNVWFILHRRKIALEKEAEKLGEKKGGLSSDSCKSDEPIYSSLDQI
ncbi:Oidioi.mRNA.OKI2018_I69.chr1.g2813.t1.cds [Oikopleura dioica]|uniref:Oidioi.mRNA.OKI2018_I69.chr1.g2813.t1.cds n=1 Tax=Oikopleura dioica TaxID=34765 RepID=A0ABN7SWK6_OIKDI|nr:Oidioi.mRNA.OKI2018_I69.chr1.g2813.t1.cds [Oikopleura dioica]